MAYKNLERDLESYFSKKDIEFTDEMFENLKITEKENHTLKKENALYLEIFNN